MMEQLEQRRLPSVREEVTGTKTRLQSSQSSYLLLQTILFFMPAPPSFCGCWCTAYEGPPTRIVLEEGV